jgi:hypothetical protein
MRYDVVRWSGGRRQRPLRVLAGISLVSAIAVGNRRERVADSSEGQLPGAYRGQEYTKLKVTNKGHHFLIDAQFLLLHQVIIQELAVIAPSPTIPTALSLLTSW